MFTFNYVYANPCAVILPVRFPWKERGSQIRQDKVEFTVWWNQWEKRSGMLVFKSYFQPEKSSYKKHYNCISCLLTFKDIQRKSVNFTVGVQGKVVPNCQAWKFRFGSEKQVGSFSFHHCGGVAQANSSRPDHAVWTAFWMKPSPRSHSSAGSSTEAAV